jgi:predicted ATP-grasp superfamily ATP-dependent carboligase
MGPFLGMDLFILNKGMERIGFYKSDYISPVIVNDLLTLDAQQSGKITLPAEFWFSKDHNMTFLMVRSGPTGGMRNFCDELVSFINEVDFTSVAILTSTMNPLMRERQSSAQIPEVFAYANNFLFKANSKFYDETGTRKFGTWIQETKSKPH